MRPAFSPPAERGIHFRRNPAAMIASYAGFVAANRSSGVGRASASNAGESTSPANLRDCSCSSRWRAVSRKSMATDLPLLPGHHQLDALRRSTCSEWIIVASLEHRVQLPPPDAHIATVEDRQRECVL